MEAVSGIVIAMGKLGAIRQNYLFCYCVHRLCLDFLPLCCIALGQLDPRAKDERWQTLVPNPRLL